jgi:hypothetical protein
MKHKMEKNEVNLLRLVTVDVDDRAGSGLSADLSLDAADIDGATGLVNVRAFCDGLPALNSILKKILCSG